MALRRSSSILKWMRYISSQYNGELAQCNRLYAHAGAVKTVIEGSVEPGSRHFSRHFEPYRMMSCAESQPVEIRDTVMYRIAVVTGDVRGAGSSAAAVITLFGAGNADCKIFAFMVNVDIEI